MKGGRTDVFSKGKRAEVMARIRGRGNEATELTLIRAFRRRKIIGWRRNQSLFGRPDFVFRACRLVVFVDGCFWHSCPIHGTKPKGNALFWSNKFDANKRRDRLVNRQLRAKGWRVMRIWEHDLSEKKINKTLGRFRKLLT